jgi:hypothetical protein
MRLTSVIAAPRPRLTVTSVTHPDTRQYFERRAEQEAVAAEQASDARAAQSHRELASHYLSLAQGDGARPFREANPAKAGTLSTNFRIVP